MVSQDRQRFVAARAVALCRKRSRTGRASPLRSRPALEHQRVKKNGDFEQGMESNRIEILAVEVEAAEVIFRNIRIRHLARE